MKLFIKTKIDGANALINISQIVKVTEHTATATFVLVNGDNNPIFIPVPFAELEKQLIGEETRDESNKPEPRPTSTRINIEPKTEGEEKITVIGIKEKK